MGHDRAVVAEELVGEPHEQVWQRALAIYPGARGSAGSGQGTEKSGCSSFARPTETETNRSTIRHATLIRAP